MIHQALNSYAKKYKIQGDSWIFLTGKREIIQDLAIKSFQVGDMKEIIFLVLILPWLIVRGISGDIMTGLMTYG